MHYGLDNLGFKHWRAGVFYVVQETSRLLVGPSPLSVKWLPAHLTGLSGRSGKLTTHLHLVSTLGMKGVVL